jgi:hypothetical protein
MSESSVLDLLVSGSGGDVATAVPNLHGGAMHTQRRRQVPRLKSLQASMQDQAASGSSGDIGRP